jgi:hypothetical protein
MAALTLSNGTQVDPATLDNTPPDAGVFKVMQTIKKLEGGDYNNRSGDSGSSAGAFQWNNDNKPLKPGELPSHWKNAAAQYLKDPNAPMTPENQNFVAYQQMKAYKDQGKSPEEIDALWNGASKDASGKYVHNSAERAQKFRDAIMGGQSDPQSNQSGYVDPTKPQQPDTNTGYGYVTPPPTPPPAAPADIAQPEPDRGILGNLAHGVSSGLSTLEKPFLGIAALPLQAGVAGYNALTGSHVADPFANGVPAGLPGAPTNTDVTPLSLEKKAGDIAQVGSYMVPGAEGLGAVAGGVGTGILQGAGSAMSEGKGLADVGAQAGLGALTGGALVGGSKLLGAGLRGAGDALSGAGMSKAVQGIKDAYTSALNLTAAERGFENRSGKDIAQVLMDNKVSLSRNSDGTLNTTEAIPKLRAVLDPLNQEADQLLNHPQGIVGNVSLNDVAKNVFSKIDGMSIPEADKAGAKKLAMSYIKAEAKNGTELTPAQADKIKQNFWGATFDRNRTSLQNDIPYLIGKEMQSQTEKAVAGTDTETSLHELNAKRGGLIDAIKRLGKLDGVRKVKGGTMGKLTGGLVGSVAGAASGMGTLGALAGDYFGGKAADFLNNPATKIGTAQAKAKVMGTLPKLAGGAGRQVGKGVSAVGRGVSKGARAVGLAGNVASQ